MKHGRSLISLRAARRAFSPRPAQSVRGEYLALAAIVASFGGFVVENVFRALREGVIDSRHQALPFLLAYGIALLTVYAALGTPAEMRFFRVRVLPGASKKRRAARGAAYFLTLCFFIFFGEMGFGLLCEYAAGVVLWDYTGIPLSVTRYTGLLTTLAFAAGVYTVMRFLFAPLMRALSRVHRRAALAIDVALGGLIFADFLIMLVAVFACGAPPEYWTLTLKNNLKLAVEYVIICL